MRKLTTHFLSLLLGVVLTFGTIRVLSSSAAPNATESSLISAKTETVKEIAQAPKPKAANLPGGSFVSAAVERTGDAVVRIDTEKTVTQRLDPFLEDPFFREFFGDRFRQQVPQERTVRGQGSGFIFDENGTILTNAHVVSQADKVTVTLKDGRRFEGVVKGTDSITDLAVVKIQPQGDMPVAPLGNSDVVKVGDWAIAVGNPVGLDNTVTLGIISTLNRSSSEVGILDKRIDFLQTDAAINPGNSGGPLLNENGEVIGINTAIRPDAMGIGFAIPINKAKSLSEVLAAGKEVPHPYVGIQMVTLTPEAAKENNQDPNSRIIVPEVEGVLVVRVIPNSPAAQGGIRAGDVILEVNRQRITEAGQLQTIVENSGLNKELPFKIQRGEKVINLKIATAQLESQP